MCFALVTSSSPAPINKVMEQRKDLLSLRLILAKVIIVLKLFSLWVSEDTGAGIAITASARMTAEKQTVANNLAKYN